MARYILVTTFDSDDEAVALDLERIVKLIAPYTVDNVNIWMRHDQTADEQEVDNG